VKLAYYAAQSVFAIFGDPLVRVPDYPFTTTALRGVALTGYATAAGSQLAAYWFSDAPPAEANGVNLITLRLPKARFTEPVLVDLRTSTVYALPKDSWTQDDKGAVFTDLPAYDSPLLLAERSLIPLTPSAR
jgi:hypothetical protein